MLSFDSGQRLMEGQRPSGIPHVTNISQSPLNLASYPHFLKMSLKSVDCTSYFAHQHVALGETTERTNRTIIKEDMLNLCSTESRKYSEFYWQCENWMLESYFGLMSKIGGFPTVKRRRISPNSCQSNRDSAFWLSLWSPCGGPAPRPAEVTPLLHSPPLCFQGRVRAMASIQRPSV